MITLTPIKPRATATTLRAVEGAIRQAYQEAAEQLLQDYAGTYATWDHKPKPRLRVSRGGVAVEIPDRIWTFVDKGTRPHRIEPRRATRLAFPSAYAAKTRPGSIKSGPGGPSGSTVILPPGRGVNHPGTKARGFTRRLKAKWKTKWPSMVQHAIHKAVK